MSPLLVSGTQLCIDFIGSLGWDGRQELGYPLLKGPYIERSPDKAVFITSTTGPGYELEGAVDTTMFQARVRGPANDQEAAELAAMLLDSLIFNARFPVQIDGTWVVRCHRLGDGPSALGSGPDDGLRWEYTCDYTITLGV